MNTKLSQHPERAMGPLSDAEQRRSLKWFYLLAGANSAFAMCTFGGGLFPLYLKELGLSPARIGMVVGMIPFLQVLALVSTPLIERLGYRRSYLIFYGSRKFTIMALVFAPWVLSAFGAQALFVFVAACVLLFGVQRSLGETAFYPWLKDVVPDDIRGRAQGTANQFGTLAAGLGLGLAGLLIEYDGHLGLGRFGGFQVGYVFFACIGLVGIAASMRMAGGHAVQRHPHHPAFLKRLIESVKDRRFLAFLLGAGVIQGSQALIGTFLSLYGKDVLEIPSGRVVHLGIAAMAGGAVSARLWGHASDRHGSRRILVTIFSLMALMPMGWMLLPLAGETGRMVGMAAAFFLFGIGLAGAMVASFRLMYNSIVSDAGKGEYLAVRYAVVGVVAGLMPVLAGQSVGFSKGLAAPVLGLPMTPFTPLFAVLMLVWAGTAWLFFRIGDE
ncbi:MAG: MFS transporter [Kiritimatiellia bacterium]